MPNYEGEGEGEGNEVSYMTKSNICRPVAVGLVTRSIKALKIEIDFATLRVMILKLTG